MVKNEQLEKNLQAARQEVEQLRAPENNAVSALGEMMIMILVEVSTLEDTMWKLYEKFVTMHKLVDHVNDLQQ